MKRRISVLAQSFDLETGEANSKPREEIIEPDNELFKDCETLTDMAETYMSFWNRLPTIQREMVLVQKIEEARK